MFNKCASLQIAQRQEAQFSGRAGTPDKLEHAALTLSTNDGQLTVGKFWYNQTRKAWLWKE
jgi:hypothetical protein